MPTAVVFDMDGVLLDSEPVHYEALRSLLASEGISWTPGDHEQSLGKTIEDTWAGLRARHGASALPGDLDARYGALMLARYRAGIDLVPGALGLLRRLASLGVPLAVASSSPRAWVDAGLQGAGNRPLRPPQRRGRRGGGGEARPGDLPAGGARARPPAGRVHRRRGRLDVGVASAHAAGMEVVLLGAGGGSGDTPGARPPHRRPERLPIWPGSTGARPEHPPAGLRPALPDVSMAARGPDDPPAG